MEKIIKRNKGITLIALIVTIIVLIILAGVAISMLSGDSGILNRASEASVATEISGFKERVSLAQMSSKANISSRAMTEAGYTATTSENMQKIATDVAKEFGIENPTNIKTATGASINTEGYTVAYAVDTEGTNGTDGQAYIAIWYTSNKLRGQINRDTMEEQYNLADIVDENGTDSRNEVALVSIIYVSNYSCELVNLEGSNSITSNYGLTSFSNVNKDLSGTSFAEMSANNNITGDAKSPIRVTGINLNKTSTSIFTGETETLTATVTPDNASNKAVTWSSSNTGVATVDANGKVTAKAGGNATITVTTQDGGKTATCQVTVTVASNLTTGDAALPSGITEIIDDPLRAKTSVKAVLQDTVAGVKIVIPKEFYYVGGTIADGVVISDVSGDTMTGTAGNQFVWIPTTYDEASDTVSVIDRSTSTSYPMARAYSSTEAALRTENTGYRGVLYQDNMTTERTYAVGSGNREPDTVTNNDGTSSDTVGITVSGLQTKYNNMVSSVKTYGGFYVGRYELGTSATNISKKGQVPVKSVTWYSMYSTAGSYSKSSIVSEMIWGSQYDAVMHYIGTSTATASPSSSGNNGNNTSHTSAVTSSGSFADSLKNIYDLQGNARELTQEANTTRLFGSVLNYRVVRGPIYSDTSTPASHYDLYPTDSGAVIGSRPSLYIGQN